MWAGVLCDFQGSASVSLMPPDGEDVLYLKDDVSQEIHHPRTCFLSLLKSLSYRPWVEGACSFLP